MLVAVGCVLDMQTCTSRPTKAELVVCFPGGLEVTEAVAEQCCKAAKANASLYSVHQLLKVRLLHRPVVCCFETQDI